MTYLTPAEVAGQTGFSLDTLRYYERIGLLLDIDRTAGGRRRFTERDVWWLNLLRCLRDTEMPIAEMLRFTEMVRAGDATRPDRLDLLESHDAHIESRIARLRECQSQLQTKITHYRDLEAQTATP